MAHWCATVPLPPSPNQQVEELVERYVPQLKEAAAPQQQQQDGGGGD